MFARCATAQPAAEAALLDGALGSADGPEWRVVHLATPPCHQCACEGMQL